MPNEFEALDPQQPAVQPPKQDDQISLEDFEEMARQKYGIPKNLLKSMVGQESGGDWGAKSPTGVKGKYQVTEATAKQYGLDRNDPFQQTVAAMKHLRNQFDALGNVQDTNARWLSAVGRYYGGEGAVDPQGGISTKSPDGVSTPLKHMERVASNWKALGLDGTPEKQATQAPAAKPTRQAPATNVPIPNLIKQVAGPNAGQSLISGALASTGADKTNPTTLYTQPAGPVLTPPQQPITASQQGILKRRYQQQRQNVNRGLDPNADVRLADAAQLDAPTREELAAVRARVPEQQNQEYLNSHPIQRVVSNLIAGIESGSQPAAQTAVNALQAVGNAPALAGNPIGDLARDAATRLQSTTDTRAEGVRQLEESLPQNMGDQVLRGTTAGAMALPRYGIAALGGGIPAALALGYGEQDWRNPEQAAIGGTANALMTGAGHVAAPIVGRAAQGVADTVGRGAIGTTAGTVANVAGRGALGATLGAGTRVGTNAIQGQPNTPEDIAREALTGAALFNLSNPGVSPKAPVVRSRVDYQNGTDIVPIDVAKAAQRDAAARDAIQNAPTPVPQAPAVAAGKPQGRFAAKVAARQGVAPEVAQTVTPEAPIAKPAVKPTNDIEILTSGEIPAFEKGKRVTRLKVEGQEILVRVPTGMSVGEAKIRAEVQLRQKGVENAPQPESGTVEAQPGTIERDATTQAKATGEIPPAEVATESLPIRPAERPIEPARGVGMETAPVESKPAEAIKEAPLETPKVVESPIATEPTAEAPVSRSSDIYRTKGTKVDEAVLDKIDERARNREATPEGEERPVGEHGRISYWSHRGFAQEGSDQRTTPLSSQPGLRKYLGLPPIPEGADTATVTKAQQHTLDALAEAMGKNRSSEITPEDHANWLHKHGVRLPHEVRNAYAETLAQADVDTAFRGERGIEHPDVQSLITQLREEGSLTDTGVRRGQKTNVIKQFQAVAESLGLPKTAGESLGRRYIESLESGLPPSEKADVSGRGEQETPPVSVETRTRPAQPDTAAPTEAREEPAPVTKANSNQERQDNVGLRNPNAPQVAAPTLSRRNVTIDTPNGEVKGHRYLVPGLEDFDIVIQDPGGSGAKNNKHGFKVYEGKTGTLLESGYEGRAGRDAEPVASVLTRLKQNISRMGGKDAFEQKLIERANSYSVKSSNEPSNTTKRSISDVPPISGLSDSEVPPSEPVRANKNQTESRTTLSDKTGPSSQERLTPTEPVPPNITKPIGAVNPETQWEKPAKVAAKESPSKAAPANGKITDMGTARADASNITRESLPRVFNEIKGEIEKNDPKLSPNRAGELAAARIRNAIHEKIADIDDRARLGNITDKEEHWYDSIHVDKWSPTRDLEQLSGSRSIVSDINEPLAKTPLSMVLPDNATPRSIQQAENAASAESTAERIKAGRAERQAKQGELRAENERVQTEMRERISNTQAHNLPKQENPPIQEALVNVEFGKTRSEGGIKKTTVTRSLIPEGGDKYDYWRKAEVTIRQSSRTSKDYYVESPSGQRLTADAPLKDVKTVARKILEMAKVDEDNSAVYAKANNGTAVILSKHYGEMAGGSYADVAKRVESSSGFTTSTFGVGALRKFNDAQLSTIASHFKAHADNFVAWGKAMIADFGASIRPKLREIWNEGQKFFKSELGSAKVSPGGPPIEDSVPKKAQKKIPLPANIDLQAISESADNAISKRKLNDASQAKAEQAFDRLLNAYDNNDAVEFARAQQKLQSVIAGSKTNTALAVVRAGLLTSPKTHLRNTLGNLAEMALDMAADLPGSIADIVASAVTGQRALTASAVKGSLEGAKMGFADARKVMRTGLTDTEMAKFELHGAVDPDSIAGKYTSFIFKLMAAEDRVFKGIAYNRAIENQAQAIARTEARQGLIKKDEIANRQKVMTQAPTEEMQAQAIHDADVLTFNNANPLATGFANWQAQASKPAQVVSTLLVPFVRTPTNIVARLFEASPFGYAKNVGQIGKALSGARSIRQASPETAFRDAVKQAFTVAEQRSFSQTFGRATVGSALIALGYALGKKGFASAIRDYDELDDLSKIEADKVTGRTGGAVKIKGHWFQIANLPPGGALIALGATFAREGEDTKNAGLADRAKEHGKTIIKAGLDQPLVHGVEELTKLAKPKGAERFAASKLAMTVPTIVGDAAGLLDSKDRKAEGLTGQLKKRIPLMRNTLPENKDAFGQSIPFAKTRAVDIFNSVADKTGDSPALQEVARLDMGIGKARLRNGESPNQLQQRMESAGKLFTERANDLVASAKYQAYTDAQKREALEQLLKAEKAESSRRIPLPRQKRARLY